MPDRIKPPSWFWIIAVVALAWNAMGALNFAMQTGPDAAAAMPEKYRAVIESRPFWALAAFGIGVVSALMGCVALLVRRGYALQLFLLSLVATLLTLLHAAPVQAAQPAFGAVDLLLTVFLPIAVAVFLVWWAWYASRRDWLS